jgi:hypothetical protein
VGTNKKAYIYDVAFITPSSSAFWNTTALTTSLFSLKYADGTRETASIYNIADSE